MEPRHLTSYRSKTIRFESFLITCAFGNLEEIEEATYYIVQLEGEEETIIFQDTLVKELYSLDIADASKA